jgi:hypothetical protein
MAIPLTHFMVIRILTQLNEPVSLMKQGQAICLPKLIFPFDFQEGETPPSFELHHLDGFI